MFFLPEVYNGTNHDSFNLMPWYETSRRMDGKRFAPEWGPPAVAIFAGSGREIEADLEKWLADSQGQGRIIRAISPALPAEQGWHSLTVIYQERLPNGADREPDVDD